MDNEMSTAARELFAAYIPNGGMASYDNLLKDYKKPEDIIGENGLLKQFNEAVVGAGHGRRVERTTWVTKSTTRLPCRTQLC